MIPLIFQIIYILLETLPLVEFELDEGITDEEAEKLIEEPLQVTDDSTLIEDQLTITNKTDLFTDHLVRYEVYFIYFLLQPIILIKMYF